ncbi:MAG: hypothetical protein ACREI9_08445 [Nitrospiraceae bacterium]
MIAIKDVGGDVFAEGMGMWQRVTLYTNGDMVTRVVMPNYQEGHPAVLVWNSRVFGWARDVGRYEEVFAVAIVPTPYDGDQGNGNGR